MQRIPALWFDDANDVIQAGNHQFHVHGDILAAFSPGLEKLFSDATQEGIQKFEGCPVFHLPDDGEDVKNFLVAFYDPNTFFGPPPKDVPLDFVLSVARLSHKYEIEHVRHRAIAHMERNYPSDMDAFLSRCAVAIPENSSWHCGFETSIDIIMTATAINALWVLPAIYYHCAHRTPSGVFHSSPSWNNPQKMPILRNILTGKINLEVMDVAYADVLGAPPCSGCLTRERCALHKLWNVGELRSLLTSSGEPAGWKKHTLMFWSDRETMADYHCKKLCAPCASASMSAYESARGDYWDNIPSAFNLPTWEELKLLRGADLGKFETMVEDLMKKYPREA